MQHKSIHSQLELHAFSYEVRLGCTPEERSVPQTIECTIKFGFKGSLKGESTDELSDTVCYAKVSEDIEHIFHKSEYQLIEKMGSDVFNYLKQKHKDCFISVSIHKLSPPIETLNKGVKYKCGDFF